MVELARYRRAKGLAPFPITGETTPLLLPNGRQTRALTRAAVHSLVKQVFKGAADQIRARGLEFESKARPAEHTPAHRLRPPPAPNMPNTTSDLPHVHTSPTH